MIRCASIFFAWNAYYRSFDRLTPSDLGKSLKTMVRFYAATAVADALHTISRWRCAPVGFIRAGKRTTLSTPQYDASLRAAVSTFSTLGRKNSSSEGA